MDIISVALTAGGAFGAGLTVGALVFSPRLVTVSRAETPPAEPERPAVYVLPVQSTGPAVMIPSEADGRTGMIPVVLPSVPVNPESESLRHNINNRCIDKTQDAKLITPAAPDQTPREGRQ